MLIAAFDASGDEFTNILSVGGFISSAEDWEDFSELWLQRLKKEGIAYFRAVEAAHFNGQFRAWKDKPKQEREAWRASLFEDLMDIVASHGYRHFGCAVVNKAFQRMSPQLQEEFYLTAYSIAGRICEKKVREWVRTEWRNTTASVQLVFEEGDQGKGKLQRRLSDDKSYSPTFRPKKDTPLDDGSLRFGFVPLQAADWYAYELSLATRDLIEGKKKIESTENLRWPMREFLKKPGVPGVFDYENAKQFEQNIELYKGLKEWWASLKEAQAPQ